MRTCDGYPQQTQYSRITQHKITGVVNSGFFSLTKYTSIQCWKWDNHQSGYPIKKTFLKRKKIDTIRILFIPHIF